MTTFRYMSGLSAAAVLTVALTACGGSSTHAASSVTKTTSASTSNTATPSTTANPTSASTSAATTQTSSTVAPASSDVVMTQTVTKTTAPTHVAVPVVKPTKAKPISKEGGYCGRITGRSGVVLDVTAFGPVHCAYAMNVAKSVVSGTFTGGSVTAYSPDGRGSFTSTCGAGDGGYMCTPPNGGSISIMIPGFKLP